MSSTTFDYTESVNAGRLVGRKCVSCLAVTFPPATTCPRCGAPELIRVVYSGKAIVLSLTVREVTLAPHEVPHIRCDVRLEEGITIEARFDYDRARITEIKLGSSCKLTGFVSEIIPPGGEIRRLPIFHPHIVVV